MNRIVARCKGRDFYHLIDTRTDKVIGFSGSFNRAIEKSLFLGRWVERCEEEMKKANLIHLQEQAK